jgi:hypothetical protein
MSDMKNFDDFFKAELGKKSSDVPSHVWDNIVEARKNRRPSGIWLSFLTDRNVFLLVGLLLIGAAGISIFSNPTNIGSTKKISSNANTVTNSTANKKGNNAPNQVTSQFLLPSSNRSSSSNTSSNNSPSNNIKLSNQLNDKNDNSLADNSTSESGHKINSRLETKIVSTTNNTAIVKADNLHTYSNDTYSKTNKIFTGINSSHLTTITHNNIRKHSKVDGSVKANATITGADEITDDNMLMASNYSSRVNRNNNNKLHSVTQGYLLNRLSFTAQKTIKPEIKIADNISTKLSFPECPTIEKDIAGNKQYLEVYISPDYGIRSLTDTSKSSAALLQQRKQSTSFSSGFSVGVRYTKVLKSGISIAGGLNYSQINEKLSYTQYNADQIAVITNSVTGDTIRIDTISGIVHKTSYNHYHSVDVPLLIGYEMGNDKIHININAGPVMNIYSWQHGEVLSQDSVPVSISSGKSSSLAYQYKTNIGLGITGGVSVFYKLNDQLHIYAEPYFRYNFSSMTNSESPIQQKYTMVGMHIGLRLDIK